MSDAVAWKPLKYFKNHRIIKLLDLIGWQEEI